MACPHKLGLLEMETPGVYMHALYTRTLYNSTLLKLYKIQSLLQHFLSLALTWAGITTGLRFEVI